MTIERPRISGTAFGWPLVALLLGGPAHGQEIPMNYPETRRADVAEEHFGERIADPYRWLEGSTPEVAAWIAAQNAVSSPYLAQLPGRETFRQRLTALFDNERLTAPETRGGRHFFTRNEGLSNQSALMMREDGTDRVLVDPNAWSEDGATALAEWAPSEDGRHVAFAVQEGGTDWRTIRVLDVESGEMLPDEVEWARFTNIAWAGDGFFYSRYPAPTASDAPIGAHEVRFHRLGTPQADDPVIHAPASGRPLIHTAEVTADGRYAAIYSTALTGGNSVALLDLADPDWTLHPLVTEFEQPWYLAGNDGPTLYLTTQEGAERGRIVTAEFGTPGFTELVPEAEDVILEAALLGGRLIVSYMDDAKTEVRRFLPDGTPDGTVTLPGIGSAGGFRGRGNEAFFVFTSLNAPTTVMRLDVAANKAAVWAEPEVPLNLDHIRVEQRFFASKDGTRVPVFIVRHKDVTGPAPTMLNAYGGYGIPMIPFYSPATIAWVEAGGVYAMANIRGGGEYGKAWHDAGRGAKKQNVFDDFIAAGEFLKAEGITTPDGLAIQGESNGGLLIGAVVNQRPDLFAAALPGVGVMDMLRFDRFTSGATWVQEFGDPAREADFRTLRAYSPLHNIRTGDYPAILATTADTDDRVVPAHSFKYIAALQAADLGTRPHILRVETRAGHGAGKPTDKTIEEIADMWAFAAHWTGLNVK